MEVRTHTHTHTHTHTPQQQDLELFASLLREQKVSEFESHLQSLTELYAQAGPAADKASVFQALTATESVLTSISESRWVGTGTM